MPVIAWWMNAIEYAKLLLRLSLVVVYPTDTVYGIGGDPRDDIAVKTVFEVKRRPPTKPVPLLVDSVESAREIGELDSRASRLIKRFWPGALTIVVPLKDKSIHELVTAGTGCVGLRLPAHPAPVHLAAAAGGAIIGTSANISGMPAKRDLYSVLVELEYDERVAVYLDGGVLEGTPSTVVNLCGDRITVEREGAIPAEQVLKQLREQPR